MYKPPCWTIYILALGRAGSAVEQLPPSCGAGDGENGEKAPQGDGSVPACSKFIWGEGLGWRGSLRRGRTVGRPHPAVALSLPSSSSLHGLPPAPSHAGGGLGDRRVTHPTLPRVEGGSWGPASPAPSPAGSKAGVRSHHPKYS